MTIRTKYEPLKMMIKVNNLQELKEHFDLPQVLEYLSDGKLVAWLRDCHETEMAVALEKLDGRNENFAEKVCDILGTEFRDMEEVTLSGEVSISAGAQKTFCYKKIHISGKIRCEGDLKFNHCVILYNELGERGRIDLSDHANLDIINSVVICKGLSKGFFIRGKANNISVTSTRFKDYSYLFKCLVERGFVLQGCCLKNCFVGFINIGPLLPRTKCAVQDSIIKFDDLTEFNRKCLSEADGRLDPAISVEDVKISKHCDSKGEFRNNSIEQSAGFTEILRECGANRRPGFDENWFFRNLEIDNCTFTSLSCGMGR